MFAANVVEGIASCNNERHLYLMANEIFLQWLKIFLVLIEEKLRIYIIVLFVWLAQLNCSFFHQVTCSIWSSSQWFIQSLSSQRFFIKSNKRFSRICLMDYGEMSGAVASSCSARLFYPLKVSHERFRSQFESTEACHFAHQMRSINLAFGFNHAKDFVYSLKSTRVSE